MKTLSWSLMLRVLWTPDNKRNAKHREAYIADTITASFLISRKVFSHFRVTILEGMRTRRTTFICPITSARLRQPFFRYINTQEVPVFVHKHHHCLKFQSFTETYLCRIFHFLLNFPDSNTSPDDIWLSRDTCVPRHTDVKALEGINFKAIQ